MPDTITGESVDRMARHFLRNKLAAARGYLGMAIDACDCNLEIRQYLPKVEFILKTISDALNEAEKTDPTIKKGGCEKSV